ncbi:Krueppel-like factor 5 [Tyrophagus putrescentiae]|nr:Krueppel-like factor 5 [Tyrophagus putrescentiae]
MAAHQILGSQASSSYRGKSQKVNDNKHFDQKSKKNHISNNNVNATFNLSAFEPPAVTTNGMKNIEQFIEKTFVEGKQWYQCKWPNCCYSSIRSDSIVRHMRKHTGERPYRCWFCSYATIQSSALKIHMRRHTGEKPYACKYENCGKKFAVLNTLVVHERTHSGFKPFKCSISSCNYTSSDRCKLVGHMRKVHQIELQAGKGPPPPQLHHVANPPMNTTAFPMISPKENPSLPSKSNPFAFVNGQMSSAQLFSPLMANYSQFAVPNSQIQAAPNDHIREKQGEMPSTSLLPLNFLSVSLPNNNQQNTLSSTVNHSKSKSSNENQRRSKQSKASHSAQSASQNNVPNRDENSIKRVMFLVDKRMVNNRASYHCKWPNCGYESLRSDSIVRHIRSHTGERPFKCDYENCDYSTIQRSTLNKHFSRHINSTY